MAVNPGRDDQFVTLSEIQDGTPTTYVPDGVWASIQPEPPTSFGENKITHRVETRYHPQITMNTVLTTDDGAQLFVRGMQNVNLRNERWVLLCEEVMTP